MNFTDFFHTLIQNLSQTGPIEFIAVIAGIASVWYSRKENILVYPVGLINTILYIWLSIKGHLLGEASVNFYYTIMSIYGWVLWAQKKESSNAQKFHISYANTKEWKQHFLFFGVFYVMIFLALSFAKKAFAPDAIPWADALASASAYTGMWMMAKKKVKSWYWWIITNIASIPLYYVKHYAFTSVYYVILLAMAFWGLAEWKKKASLHQPI